MIEDHDVRTIYCIQLGGQIPFRYCRTVSYGLPCRKIVVCWEFRLEVARFLNENYSLEQIEQALTPPDRTKMETILELIEKAKKEKAKEEG